jgi:hypothetical protein
MHHLGAWLAEVGYVEIEVEGTAFTKRFNFARRSNCGVQTEKRCAARFFYQLDEDNQILQAHRHRDDGNTALLNGRIKEDYKRGAFIARRIMSQADISLTNDRPNTGSYFVNTKLYAQWRDDVDTILKRRYGTVPDGYGY